MEVCLLLQGVCKLSGRADGDGTGSAPKKKRKKKPAKEAPGGIRIIDEDSTGFRAVKAAPEPEEEEEDGVPASCVLNNLTTIILHQALRKAVRVASFWEICLYSPVVLSQTCRSSQIQARLSWLRGWRRGCAQ